MKTPTIKQDVIAAMKRQVEMLLDRLHNRVPVERIGDFYDMVAEVGFTHGSGPAMALAHDAESEPTEPPPF